MKRECIEKTLIKSTCFGILNVVTVMSYGLFTTDPLLEWGQILDRDLLGIQG